MPLFNPLSTFPRHGSFVLLHEERLNRFWPAFWDESIDEAFPIRFISDTRDLVSLPLSDYISLDGLNATDHAGFSWLPFPTTEDYPPKNP